jgi:hypothetical protein
MRVALLALALSALAADVAWSATAVAVLPAAGDHIALDRIARLERVDDGGSVNGCGNASGGAAHLRLFLYDDHAVDE